MDLEIGSVPSFAFNMAPLAVSWFFILSGFVIAYNYPELSTPKQRADFLIMRFARIWPVHAIILTAIAAVLVVAQNGYTLRHSSWLIFHYTLTQSWTMNADIAQAFNGPAWSVSDELFFYIAYVAMLAPYRWLRLTAVVLPITIGFALPIVQGCFDSAASIEHSSYCNMLVFQFPPGRLIEFVAGIAICRLNIRVPQIIGATASIAVFFSLMPSIPFIETNEFTTAILREIELIIGGGALIASLTRAGWLSRLLSCRPLVIGGEISYSMYLTHQIIILGVLPRFQSLTLANRFLLLAAITIGVSSALFYFVERPARALVKSILRRKRDEERQLIESLGISR